MLNLFSVIRAVIIAPLAQNRLRSLLSVCAIALGVALGVSINLINASAVAEFSRAMQTVSGEADLVVRGPQHGFDESLFPSIARLPEVALAGPAIELEARLRGRRDWITVLGIDPFQSTRLQPALSAGTGERNLLEPDTVMVSPDVAQRLDLKQGGKLELQTGSGTQAFEVIAILPAQAKSLALMDIANAQWRFAMLGRINRIDLKLERGIDAKKFQQNLDLPAGVNAAWPDDADGQGAELSRAYRVNLNMLALVALFTGAFLVFSTQALSVMKRRSHFALIKVLGLTDRSLLALVLLEAAVLGTIGAVLGIVCGTVVAQAALQTVGPDLGAGYFRADDAALEFDPVTLGIFFLLGVGAAVGGALIPALKAAAVAPARALRSGSAAETPRKLGAFAGALALAAGITATFAPPVSGLPLFGYAAIALILLGACLLMPLLLAQILARVPRPRRVSGSLALSRLRASSNETALSLCAILVAFSVMVAMAIMVSSFRESLEHWLIQVLPADLYVRARGDAAFISAEEQRALSGLAGVRKAAFSRYHELRARPGEAPLMLIARDDPQDLPAVGARLIAASESPPLIWVSEAAADLYGYAIGDTIQLPIADKHVNFGVAGIWRDYARTTGAVAIERDLYVELTGDRRANDAAIWFAPGTDASVVASLIRNDVAGELEIAQTHELHSRSLRSFDRTFAVTYLLEAVAVLVGLLAVSSSFSARVLDRRGEFGMLRHIGASRRRIAQMLAYEGAVTSTLGAALGLFLGTALSLILIFVVNRQSFHWSMDFHFPSLMIATLAAAMVIAGTMSAVLGGRKAMSDDVLTAVREDW